MVGFGSSAALAAAYGIAVTGTLAIDTVLFFVVVHILWKKPLRLSLAGGAAFLVVDLTFFAANVPKIQHGGWFPLAIAALVFVVLTTWQRGREIITKRRTELEGPLRDFVEEMRDLDKPINRAPAHRHLPRRQPRHDAARPARQRRAQLRAARERGDRRRPHAQRPARRGGGARHVDDLGYRDDGITHVTARFGFQDDLDVPRTLRLAAERLEREVDFDAVSYFLSRITIVATNEPGMARWRKKLFIAIARNAASPVPYFHLPDDRTIVMAAHVEL